MRTYVCMYVCMTCLLLLGIYGDVAAKLLWYFYVCTTCRSCLGICGDVVLECHGIAFAVLGS